MSYVSYNDTLSEIGLLLFIDSLFSIGFIHPFDTLMLSGFLVISDIHIHTRHSHLRSFTTIGSS